MQAFLNFLVPLVSVFQGPIMGVAEKGVAAAIVWAFAKGGLDPASASGVAGELWLAISGTITAISKTQTAKIQNVNAQDNGVKVVPIQSATPAVSVPLK